MERFETPRNPDDEDLFYINIGNQELSFRAEHAGGFTHDEPEYDHIFAATKFAGEKPVEGIYLFREMLEQYGIDIEEVFSLFIENDIKMTPQGEPTDMDKQLYEVWKKGNNALPLTVRSKTDDEELLPNPESDWTPEYDERATKYGKFVAYLAEQIANGTA